MPDMPQAATVDWFNAEKGYGFLSLEGDGRAVFVHYSAIQGEGWRTLLPGERVVCTVSAGPRGLRAERVHRPQAPAQPASDAAG